MIGLLAATRVVARLTWTRLWRGRAVWVAACFLTIAIARLNPIAIRIGQVLFIALPIAVGIQVLTMKDVPLSNRLVDLLWRAIPCAIPLGCAYYLRTAAFREACRKYRQQRMEPGTRCWKTWKEKP